jgi:hypothetical protein
VSFCSKHNSNDQYKPRPFPSSRPSQIQLEREVSRKCYLKPGSPVKMSELDYAFALFAALVYFSYKSKSALLYFFRFLGWGVKRLFIRIQSRQRTMV